MADINVTVGRPEFSTVVTVANQSVSVSRQEVSVTVGRSDSVVVVGPGAVDVFVGPRGATGPQGPQGPPGAPGVGGSEAIAAKVFYLAQQSANSGNLKKIEFDAEAFDSDAIFNIAQKTRLTCRTAGTYAVEGQIQIGWEVLNAWAADGKIDLILYKNGNTEVARATEYVYEPNTIPTRKHVLRVSTHLLLEQSDYIELAVLQNGGVVATLYPGENLTAFSMVRETSALDDLPPGEGGGLGEIHLAFTKETPLKQGAYLLGTYTLAHTGGDVDLLTIEAEYNPDGFTVELEVDGTMTGISITMAPGQLLKSELVDLGVPTNQTIRAKATTTGADVESWPSGVCLTARIQ